MRLTVLGKSPSWQDAGGACSGYLIEEDDTVVLVDCGNGVFAKLRERIDYVDVDAVVISHLHADHFLDLVPYSYALTYAPRQQPVPVDRWPGTDCPACPILHVPPGARDLFRRVVGSWGNEDLIEKAFELREYEASSEVEIGPIRIRFQPVPHFTETFAMSICSTNGSGRIVYGADSSPTEALEEFAREAGEHARAAGAKRLLLVHISDELDWNWARDQAAETFGGPVEVAREGAVYEV
jgi:ribonuclease BN (tRNA processing enzyme)